MLTLSLTWGTLSAGQATGATTEPLRVHPTNPRYFANGSGQAVYLAGHQCFVDLQDNSFNKTFMLFEVYGFLGGEACGDPKQTLWDGNVFNGANNINGIDADEDGNGKGIEFFYTDDARILRLQQAYVKKVVDTVNHLDNVFYEIANELYAPQWQYRMIEFIKWYDTRQHKGIDSGRFKPADAQAVFTPAHPKMVLWLTR